MIIKVNSNTKYNVLIEKNLLDNLKKHLPLKGKVLLSYDSNLPADLINKIKKQFDNIYMFKVLAGEASKSIEVYEKMLLFLLENEFSRKDHIIALGGGVVGDLTGFVASTYKRGLNFYNIPTTTLSMVDSSIGGKVALNLGNVKNAVGNFYNPKKVLIDLNVLDSLPKRQFYNGLVEALKSGLIMDKKLYEIFLKENYLDDLERIIYSSLKVKKKVVEKDFREENLRKILNFGHTLGHAIESYFKMEELLHGEAVACGMLYMIDNEELKLSVTNILKKMNINCDIKYDKKEVLKLVINDKKTSNGCIDIIKVNSPGKYLIHNISLKEFENKLMEE